MLPLSAQNPDAVLLAEIDAVCARIASAVERKIVSLKGAGPAPQVFVENFYTDRRETPFGSLVALNVRTALAGRSTLSVRTTPDNRGGLHIRGEVIRIGPLVRINAQLVRMEDQVLLWSEHADLPGNNLILDMLAFSGEEASVSWDAWEMDRRENPVALEVSGSQMNRSLHDGDEDWFSINLNEAAIISVYTSGSVDTYLTAYESGGTRELKSNDDGFSDDDSNLNANLTLSCEAGKTYLFRVTGFEGATGFYGIQAERAVVDDSGEPNDTLDMATELAPGTSLTASFSDSSDVDWYRIEVGAGGGVLYVSTTGSQDTVIHLYDQNEDHLAEADDTGDDYNASLRIPVSSGAYYIKITDFDEHSGRYTVQADILASDSDD